MASEKITKIIDAVKELSVLELKELIDTYCEEFGVSAVAAAAPAAAADVHCLHCGIHQQPVPVFPFLREGIA